LKSLADSKNPVNLKIVLTILNFSRSWELSDSEWNRVKPDFKSISSPQKRDFYIFESYLSDFVKDFNLKLPSPKFKYSNVYMSEKAGPQGPASKTAMMNLSLYDEETKLALTNITDKNGRVFLDASFKEGRLLNESPKIPVLGKLSFVKDPEAKLRIIAISDYYTQLFLKPIHDDVLSLLKKFKCDRTFTQNPFHNWENDGEAFYSLDLSSATDRFPINLQERLLGNIYDKDVAQNWRYILSNRKFGIDTYELTHNKSVSGSDTISYACGQPMGTYSS
jgi:hypothetical protein